MTDIKISSHSKGKIHEKTTDSDGGQAYYMVFVLLLQAMLVTQESVGTRAKELNVLANAQEDIDKVIGSIKYAELPAGNNVTQEEISEVETANLHASNEKQMEQSLLMNAKQLSQVSYSSANADVSETMQNSAADTAFLGALGTVFKLINNIIDPQ